MSTPALIALITASVAGALVLGVLIWLFRRILRARRVGSAAIALIDVHMGTLDTRIATLADNNEGLIDDATNLSASLQELRDSLEQLTFLAGAIPVERRKLRKLLIDTALPD